MPIALEKGRTTRTRRAMVNALLELLESTPLAEVTVTQVVQRASVARRTFYLNYASTDDVLREYMSIRFRDLVHALEQRSSRAPARDAVAFYAFCREHAAFLRLLDKNGKQALLLDEFEYVLSESGVFDPANVVPSGTPPQAARYAQVAIAAVLWRTTLEWLRSGMRESPAQMAECLSMLLPSEGTPEPITKN